MCKSYHIKACSELQGRWPNTALKIIATTVVGPPTTLRGRFPTTPRITKHVKHRAGHPEPEMK